MKVVVTLFAVTSLQALAAGPKAPGTEALYRATVLNSGAEEYVEGVGLLRSIRAVKADAIGPFETSDDSSLLVFRVQTEGLAAARLYIRDMALPAGARLFVYGVSGSGVITNVYGPVEGAGPLQSGDFWTTAITGSEIVVELQATEPLADLPFEIVGFASADPSEAVTHIERIPSETRTSIFRGMELTHAVENGIAIFEGDIVLGNVDELPEVDSRAKKSGREAVGITGNNYRWPGGIIPYAIDPALPTPSRVTTAISQWNSSTAGHVNWIPRTTETAYVQFARAASTGTCSSAVGRMGYPQAISIGDLCSSGNILHEMGHAVGLWHEQSREDRDMYVKILWENMNPSNSYNFTQSIANGDDLGVYDYGSLMHYPQVSFSINGKPTVETIPPGIPIGQRGKLSTGDIAAVKAMYPSSSASATTPTVTIDSIPTGLTITVDGVNYKTPKAFQWTPGSVHTLTAGNPTVTNGTRNVFVRWTDGGDQTHTIIAPTTSTTYRADYATSYLADITSAGAGTVSVSPASTDDFYPKASSVAIEAVASAGYCFTSWTGLVAGTPGKTNLSMQKAYTVQANYAPGAISVSPATLTMPTAASTRQITVDATAGCIWMASSPESWVKISAGATGSGPGVVTISTTTRNSNAAPRSATLTIAGQPVVVTQ